MSVMEYLNSQLKDRTFLFQNKRYTVLEVDTFDSNAAYLTLFAHDRQETISFQYFPMSETIVNEIKQGFPVKLTIADRGDGVYCIYQRTIGEQFLEEL